MAKLAGRRYAHALFELAVENNELDLLETQIKDILEVCSTNREFINVINHPHIGVQEKTDILKNVFKDNISDTILGLISVVFKKNREAELVDILQFFIEKAKEHRGIVTAKITSATELSQEQTEKIITNLSKNLNKQVEIEKVVDASLIGGVRIEVDGKVIDGSIKNQLSNMKKQLLDLQLA